MTVLAPAPGNARRSPKTPFARPDFAHAGVATGQHGPLDAVEIQCGHLLRREHAVLLVGCRDVPTVGAGKDQTRQEQWVLPCDLRRAAAAWTARRIRSRRTAPAEEEPVRRQMQDAPPGRLRLESRLARRGTRQPERAEWRRRAAQRDLGAAVREPGSRASRPASTSFREAGSGFEPHRLKIAARRPCATERRPQRQRRNDWTRRRRDRPSASKPRPVSRLASGRHEIPFRGQVVDHGPGFDEILRRGGRQRGEAHEVKRAIGDDEHARRVRQMCVSSGSHTC